MLIINLVYLQNNYNNFMKYLLSALFIFIVFLGKNVSADTFELHFYYNLQTNTLRFLDDQHTVLINKNNDISIRDFSETDSTGPFYFSFLDSTGYEIEGKQFTPQNGAFIISTPYYSTAKRLVVHRVNTESILIDYDLSILSSCNNNSICEFEKGENINTCLPDCASGHVTYSISTQEKLDDNQGMIRDQKTGAILLNNVNSSPISSVTTPNVDAKSNGVFVGVLFMMVSLIIIGGFWYFFQQRK